MRLFDYQWPRHREEKLEALKAWAVAALESFAGDDGVAMGPVLGHAVAKMTTKGLAPSKTLLAKLRHDLEEWLKRFAA